MYFVGQCVDLKKKKDMLALQPSFFLGNKNQ